MDQEQVPGRVDRPQRHVAEDVLVELIARDQSNAQIEARFRRSAEQAGAALGPVGARPEDEQVDPALRGSLGDPRGQPVEVLVAALGVVQIDPSLPVDEADAGLLELALQAVGEGGRPDHGHPDRAPAHQPAGQQLDRQSGHDARAHRNQQIVGERGADVRSERGGEDDRPTADQRPGHRQRRRRDREQVQRQARLQQQRRGDADRETGEQSVAEVGLDDRHREAGGDRRQQPAHRLQDGQPGETGWGLRDALPGQAEPEAPTRSLSSTARHVPSIDPRAACLRAPLRRG